jgi:hypothetical protein
MRSSSPESVASSSRSWNKKYTNNYLTHTKNYSWRKAESVYSSDDEHQEKLQSKLAFKANSKNSSKARHLPHPETFVFHYQLFEQINVCSLEEKTFESTRVDWFGMLEGRFSGKDLPLKYFHHPQDLKTSALDLMIAQEEDKLYLPVDINEHINEMLHYIMADYHKPSIFMKMW